MSCQRASGVLRFARERDSEAAFFFRARIRGMRPARGRRRDARMHDDGQQRGLIGRDHLRPGHEHRSRRKLALRARRMRSELGPSVQIRRRRVRSGPRRPSHQGHARRDLHHRLLHRRAVPKFVEQPALRCRDVFLVRRVRLRRAHLLGARNMRPLEHERSQRADRGVHIGSRRERRFRRRRRLDRPVRSRDGREPRGPRCALLDDMFWPAAPRCRVDRGV